ncbi:cellulose synthase/poly-beta-1,6-N-acetylglucosamine synthase-like glycosyltransferase [Microbacterium resistens]|uniref:Cellulose synthase/poly-beta-1,6-N-acetylglucosamine synthase-like glycosyltransferase n=1 Tax=Microbacterium resistens TaxID=156977 RepID=A0ABU1SG61_9MICO|nr:glycosyltransferase [Microbacterium resistens]MDR6867847.1 cellulose synthase/poly-beta-1,6-N-acetylglucosamine synthase-like glycosyltransferase [Microbacterium resistens]
MIASGVLTEGQIRKAIRASEEDGFPPGEHLMHQGAITRGQLFQILAGRWGLEFVDLDDDPADPDLVRVAPSTALVGASWVPWRRVDGGAVIAVSVQPTEELVRQARIALGMPIVAGVVATDQAVEETVARVLGPALAHDAAEGFAEERPEESARSGMRTWQRLLPLLVITGIALSFLLGPAAGMMTVLGLANLALFAMVAVKIVAGLGTLWTVARARSARRRQAIRARRPDESLPIYTILVPAYREANVIGKLLETIDRLDYPRNRLDVILLLEADDEETRRIVREARPPLYVRTLVVPPGFPRTKPRACNYGLRFARGEYVVIYDAEDRPDAGQLRAAVEAFERPLRNRRDSRPIGALQCGLHYFNAHHNALTRLFAIEYAFWFDAMLPGLQRLRLPIPLGGTSNHFRVEVLRHVGGWDAYNVTEDADLGLRVASRGYRIDVLDSTTWEEGCAQLPAWIRQRTRWIKGYMMTGAVNSRHPVGWVRQNGARGLASLLLLIAGTPLAFLTYPLLLLVSLLLLIPAVAEAVALPGWFVVAAFSVAATSHILMIGAALASAWRRYDLGVAAFALLSPVYWLLHSVAAYRALWQLYVSPFRWEKTPHGLTATDAEERVALLSARRRGRRPRREAIKGSA